MSGHRGLGPALWNRLEGISPRAVEAFAVARGWHASVSHGPYAVLLRKQVGEDVHEAVLPTTAAVRDYALRLGDLFEAMAEADRSYADLLLAEFLRTQDAHTERTVGRDHAA